MDAVIFDMDGLLLDTERPAVDAWMDAAAELDVALEREAVIRTIGVDWPGTARIITDAIGDEAAFRVLVERMKQRFHDILAQGVPAKPGAAELLRELKRRGIPAAVATSTARRSALWKLESAGLVSYFSGFACGDEVQRGKPAPDVFLLAASAVGADPSRCVALEDSPAGLAAARAAGMRTIMVPDLVAPGDETRGLADHVTADLFEAARVLFGESVAP